MSRNLYLVPLFPNRQRLSMAKANINANALEATREAEPNYESNNAGSRRSGDGYGSLGRSLDRVRSLDGRRTDMRDKS